MLREKWGKIAEELAELTAKLVFPIDRHGPGMNAIQIAENFRLREFQCSCCGVVKMDPELIRRLQAMRDEIGQPLIINSGYRCPEHNQAVGGAKDSQHIHGRAADISCPSIQIGRLHTLAEKYFPDGGVGKYLGYVHVDTRGVKARWNG